MQCVLHKIYDWIVPMTIISPSGAFELHSCFQLNYASREKNNWHLCHLFLLSENLHKDPINLYSVAASVLKQ